MKQITYFIFAAFIAFASCSNSKAGTVKMNFDVKRGSSKKSIDNNFRGLMKRSEGEENIGISNEQTFYLANITIGTPPQDISVLLDTGSSDLWVISNTNPYCSNPETAETCVDFGTFDSDESSTFSSTNNAFSIEYEDGSTAQGNLSVDTVTVGGDVTVSDANFAVATTSNSSIGIFGISFAASESTEKEYDNFPVQLKKQGTINTVAYSLYLNNVSASFGSILFGGIDNAKYQGKLTSIAMVPDPEYGYIRTQIPLSSVTYKKNGLTEGVYAVTSNAVLDSGTTLTYLPTIVSELIASSLGAEYSSYLGAFTLTCPSDDSEEELTYRLGSLGETSIKVPLSQLILSLYEYTGESSDINSSTCVLGVIPNEDIIILGDNFLRSAYSVFDLDNKTISIAQVVYTENEDISILG